MSDKAMNTNKYDWAGALKVEVGDLSSTASTSSGNSNSAAPIAAGRYPAFLQEIKHGTFKKGSYGITSTFVIESGPAKNRKLKDYVVLTKADGTPTPYGNATLKRRLMAYGLPIEKINAFKGPRNEHDLGDFRLAVGAAVTIVVKEDGEYNGRPSRKVAGVYSRVISEE